MIPVWLLTILHYVSLASAVVILLLLAWPSYRSLVSQTRTHNAQTTSENGTSVSEQSLRQSDVNGLIRVTAALQERK